MAIEFVAFLVTIQDALWLKHFLDHLGVNANTINLILTNYDS